MTLTQVLLLILVLLVVAAFAYNIGRQSNSSSSSQSEPRRNAPDSVTPIALPTDSTASSDSSAPKQSSARPTASPRAAPTTTAPAPRNATPRTTAHTAVSSWGYQLQNLNIQHAADSPYDLLVVDYAKDGSDDSALTPSEIARLKTRPDGSQRLVIAYLSIGEAESYRGYWQSSWKKNKPSWLLDENPEWEENYAVCFWDPGWQSIICGSASARLDRLIAAGFDGVYFDKCDVYEDMRSKNMPAAKTRPNLEADMIAFVQRLSAYAKAKNPNFIVIIQNTEGLLESAPLRRALDGIGKEELIFGVDSPEKKNTREEFDYSREALDRMKADGKMVLIIEYLNNPTKIAEAKQIAASLGYTLFISPKDRDLKKLPYDTPVA